MQLIEGNSRKHVENFIWFMKQGWQISRAMWYVGSGKHVGSDASAASSNLPIYWVDFNKERHTQRWPIEQNWAGIWIEKHACISSFFKIIGFSKFTYLINSNSHHLGKGGKAHVNEDTSKFSNVYSSNVHFYSLFSILLVCYSKSKFSLLFVIFNISR